MENVFFKPWVGENYETGGIFGKRILVLGEAHLCHKERCEGCGDPKQADDCADFTSEHCIKVLLDGWTDSWTPSFRKFERSLVNHDTDLEESRKIWNSVAFYNYVQKPMGQARKCPEWVDFQNSQKAFFEVLDELKPELIIVWGVSRMYERLPGGERWIPGEPLKVEEYPVKNGYYRLANGEKARVLWVYHPSAGYSWDWWHKVIKTELP